MSSEDESPQQPEVHQIIVGTYVEQDNNDTYKAIGSVSLIKDHSKVILVDCGGPNDDVLLLEELDRHHVTKDQVNVLVCTHGHIDHVGNLNLFKNATIYLDHDIAHPSNLYTSCTFENENCSCVLTPNVDILSTPGHSSHDLSVCIKNVPDKGVVIVAGDIFEREEDLCNDDLWRVVSWNIDMQKKSREKILKLANYVIPGHGPMFCVRRSD